jgi:hypothetical protein
MVVATAAADTAAPITAAAVLDGASAANPFSQGVTIMGTMFEGAVFYSCSYCMLAKSAAHLCNVSTVLAR